MKNNIFKNYEKLNETDKKIMQFLIKESKNLKNYTAQEIGNKLFVSKTTVINLAKKMGFKGFTELKYSLGENVQEEEIVDKKGKEIFSDISYEINRTIMIQNEMDLENAAAKIRKAKMVYVTARGASIPFAEYLSTRLTICKIKSIFVKDPNLLEIIVDDMEKDEMMIILSQSGETEGLIAASSKANIRNLDLISITSFGKNRLQKICNSNLYFYANESDTKNKDLISRVGMNIVIQLLIEFIKKGV